MKKEIKNLAEELKKWEYPTFPGELLAIEDDNVSVHLVTKNGYTRATMPKEVYESLKEYKSGV